MFGPPLDADCVSPLVRGAAWPKCYLSRARGLFELEGGCLKTLINCRFESKFGQIMAFLVTLSGVVEYVFYLMREGS